MIEIRPESRGNVLAIRGSRKLTAEDYDELLIPSLQGIIKNHGKARLFFEMGQDFRGWNIDAAWRATGFSLKHKDAFEKVALVCGPTWVHWAMKLTSNFVTGDVRTFPCDKRYQALEWINS